MVVPDMGQCPMEVAVVKKKEMVLVQLSGCLFDLYLPRWKT